MKVIDINNFINVVCEDIRDDKYYWIIADGDEIGEIGKFIDIDDESIDDCKNFSKSPKVSFFNDYIFILLNVLTYPHGIVVSKEVYIFLTKKYIITICRGSIDILNQLIDDIKSSRNCFILKDRRQPDILFYYIFDRIIIRNYEIISKLEAKVDEIEINILRDPRKEQLNNLITLRRQVYKVRKYINPLRHIGDSLVMNDNFIIGRENLKYFIGISKKIEKLMLSLESLVQDLAMVREAFESEVANKTNELMKIFTVVTSIFMPLNLITSMYGMNLKGIPFVEMENGCHYVIILMVVTAFILIVVFRKNKWI